MTVTAVSGFDAEWFLKAARGDVRTDEALAYVRIAKSDPVGLKRWPDLADALEEGDRRFPDDDRTADATWKAYVDADPATEAAFEAQADEVADQYSAGPLYRSTRLDTVKPERVTWVWPPRFPRGKLVTIDGDPDVGKSTLTLDLVARLTTGRPMPGEDMAAMPASPVVLLAAEDGLADTIRPRLDAAGAEPALVHHFDSVPVFDDDGQVVSWAPPSIPEDLAALEALIVSTGAVLVVVDVLMAYLSGRADSHRDQDVRRALSQLADIADRTGACVVLLRHLRKSRGAAMYAGGGSIGIIGVARAGLVAAIDPTDETATRRILARSKGNLAPPYPSLAYQLVSDESLGVARVEWLGTVAMSGDELLAPPQSEEERSDGDEATEWLRSVLSDGPMAKAELDRLARAEGISAKSLRTARERLSVVVERDESTRGRPSTWSLPDYVPPITCPPDGARNPQASDQGKHPADFGYVPKGAFGHVTKPASPHERPADAADEVLEW